MFKPVVQEQQEHGSGLPVDLRLGGGIKCDGGLRGECRLGWAGKERGEGAEERGAWGQRGKWQAGAQLPGGTGAPRGRGPLE